MLPLEKQVCSQELSKQLYELGVREESLFWHTEKQGVCSMEYLNDSYVVNTGKILYPAYTSAELGDKWPKWITVEKNSQEEYFASSKFFVHNTTAETMADAMAKMLIYSIKTGLVKV